MRVGQRGRGNTYPLAGKLAGRAPAKKRQNDDGQPSFEWTVREVIDCRALRFGNGAEAVNYITSHDVEGFRRERLFTMPRGDGQAEKWIKLAPGPGARGEPGGTRTRAGPAARW